MPTRNLNYEFQRAYKFLNSGEFNNAKNVIEILISENSSIDDFMNYVDIFPDLIVN